jgi:DNA-binding CsgD family transcriptional regulator
MHPSTDAALTFSGELSGNFSPMSVRRTNELMETPMYETEPLPWIRRSHSVNPLPMRAPHDRRLPELAAIMLLEQTTTALLILRQDGTIIWSNRAADALLAREELGRRVRFLRDHPFAMRIPDSDGNAIVVTTRPLALPSENGELGEVVIVVIARIEADELSIPTELLEALYGLTRAEARVAVEISRGRTIAEIAEEQGVGDCTVRSQIKCAFAKMGVRRQPELVRLVVSLGTLPLG